MTGLTSATILIEEILWHLNHGVSLQRDLSIVPFFKCTSHNYKAKVLVSRWLHMHSCFKT